MKYHYSSYWGSWSRVLSEEGMEFVEVNLTPVRGYGWDDVWPATIRRHGTMRKVRDIETDKLPHDIMQDIKDALGSARLHYLLNEDFLPQIDWALYRLHCNGGARFENILKSS